MSNPISRQWTANECVQMGMLQFTIKGNPWQVCAEKSWNIYSQAQKLVVYYPFVAQTGCFIQTCIQMHAIT